MTRSLRIERVPATTLVCIKWNGGGEVPALLSGNYTSHAAAKQAIVSWQATQPAEREVEVESPSEDVDKERAEARKRGRPATKSI